MDSNSTDRIEKDVVLRAPRARVWKALADSKEFGAWFGVKLDVDFTPGARIRGRIIHSGFEHVPMELTVELMEPEQRFSFRWHPYAIDPAEDYSHEPMTRIEFTLTDVDGGTRLSVVESGFGEIPPARRAQAFEMNSGGWAAQMKAIEAYLNTHA